MIALALAALLAAPPASGKSPPVDLPGLEALRWGMSSPDVARRVEGFAWIAPYPDAAGGGMANARARVAGREAILTLQFGRGHLAVVFVNLEPPTVREAPDRFFAVTALLTARYGAPAKRFLDPDAEPSTRASVPMARYAWRTRTTVLEHFVGYVDARLAHLLLASDRRRPDYGDPGPDYLTEE